MLKIEFICYINCYNYSLFSKKNLELSSLKNLFSLFLALKYALASTISKKYSYS